MGRRGFGDTTFSPTPTGRKGPSRRRGGRRARLYMAPNGELVQRRWPRGWRPERRRPKEHPDDAKSPWKAGKGGKRYALFWVYEPRKCKSCHQVRTVHRYLRLFTAGRRAGGRGWWVYSRRVAPREDAEAFERFLEGEQRAEGQASLGRYLPGRIKAEVYAAPPDIECSCESFRIPKKPTQTIEICLT